MNLRLSELQIEDQEARKVRARLESKQSRKKKKRHQWNGLCTLPILYLRKLPKYNYITNHLLRLEAIQKRLANQVYLVETTHMIKMTDEASTPVVLTY